MASISSVGIGSGVLTSELIDDLVAVERESADKRINAEQENLEAEISELGNISNLAETFRSSVNSLSLASSFQSNTTSSTNETALTATASSFASPGAYTIETTQLARSQTVASGVYSELDEVIGEGELVFNFGSVDYDSGLPSFAFTADPDAITRKVNIDGSNNTLNGVRDAVNNADIGVQATIVDTGSGFRLLFQSAETGDSNGFTLGVDNALNGLGSLAFEDDTTTMLQTVEAQNAELKVNGLDITRESNLVVGVINGITLNLKQDDAGPVTLTVERDSEAVLEKMESFIGAYNELKQTINDLTAFDTDSGNGSIFTGDSTIRRLVSNSQNILSSTVAQLAGEDFRTLSEVGLTTNSKTGQITFDSAKFEGILQSNAEGLTTLFGTTGVSSDPLVNFISSTDETQVGNYEVVVSRLAKQASYTGLTTAGGLFTIDDGNDQFSVNIDDTVSAIITLDKGIYTGSELAEIIQSSIAADLAINTSGKSASVTYDATEKQFSITSSTYGSSSVVGFASVDSTSASTLGFNEPSQGGHSGNTSVSLKATSDLAASVTINGGNDDFTLKVGEVTSGSIQIANGTYTDGDALATAMQSAINNDSSFKSANITATVSFNADLEGGQYQMSFEKNSDGKQHGFTVIDSEAAMAASFGLSEGAGKFDELASLAITDTLNAPISSTAEFKIQANGIWSDTISVALSSSDGSDIASAIQAAIMADANFVAAAEGASTPAGSLDITAGPIDFTSTPKAVGIEYNGSRFDLVVDANGTAVSDLDGDGNIDDIDNVLQSVQDQIDATVGLVGNVTVDRTGVGLVFKTVATGPNETLNMVADGSGAKTALGFAAITGTEDFTGGNETTFTLAPSGVEIDITLDGDAAAGDTVSEVQAYIQGKIDAELDALDGYKAGDISVELDALNNIYFQTNSKNSVSTSDTVGSGAVLEVKNMVDPLNLFPTDSVYSNGFDGSGALEGFGIESGIYRGEDLTQVTVTYDGSTAGGSFKIDFGNDVNFHVQEPNVFTSSTLGLAETNASDFGFATGENVSGTIGGIAALGTGKRLVGATGSAVEGLRLDVLGGSLGVRGDIDFSRGIADRLEGFLDDFLSANGGLGIKQTGLQSDLASLAEEKIVLDTRIESFQTRLAAQFSYNDILVSQLNSTQSFLEQQFEILSAIYKNK